MTLRLVFIVCLSLFLNLDSKAWFNGDWLSRHRITVKSSQVNGTVTDFPVLIELEDMPKAFFKDTRNDGADIRVTAADAVTELPFELVNFSRAKRRGELYFRAPMISNGSDTDFFIYYNNAVATAYAATDAYGSENLWINGGLAVYQMNSNPVAGIIDSSHFDKDLTVNGSMTASNSIKNVLGTSLDFDGSDDEAFFQSGTRRKVQTPRAYDFDGTDDVVDFGDHADFSFTDGAGNDEPFSIAGWIKTSTGTGTILAKHVTANATDGEYHLSVAGGQIYFRTGKDSANAYFGITSAAGVVTTNTWHHIVGTYNGSEANSGFRIYLDGKEIPAAVTNFGVYDGMENTTGEVTAGARGVVAPQHRLNGLLKDVRLYSRELNADDVYKIYSSGKVVHPTDLVLHVKAEETNEKFSYDSSGNNHLGEKLTINPSTFHTTDRTAPVSFTNQVGYSDAEDYNLLNHGVNFANWAANSEPPVTFSQNGMRLTADGVSFIDARLPFTYETDTVYTAEVTVSENNVTAQSFKFFRRDLDTVFISNGFIASNGNTGPFNESIDSTASPGTYYISFRTKSSGISNFFWMYMHSGCNLGDNVLVTDVKLYKGFYRENLPRDESNTSQDIFGNALEYPGQVPNYAFPNRSTAAYFNGSTTFTINGTSAHPDWDFTNNGFSILANINTPNTGVTRFIFSKATWGSGRGVRLGINSSNEVSGAIGNGNSLAEFSSAAIPTDTDQKVAMTWDHSNGALKLFREGASISRFASGVTSANYVSDPREADIGVHHNGNQFLGLISGVSIYNRTLSDSEVFDAFDNDNYAGQNGLLAYYPMAEGNGDTLYNAAADQYHVLHEDGTTEELWSRTQNGYHYNFNYGFNRAKNLFIDAGDLSTANWLKVTAPGQGATTVVANVITFDVANSNAWLDYPTVYQQITNPNLIANNGDMFYTTYTLSGVPGTTIGIRCSSQNFNGPSAHLTITLNATPTEYQCDRTPTALPETWINYGIYRTTWHTASTVNVHKVDARKNTTAPSTVAVPALINNNNLDVLGNNINSSEFFSSLDSELLPPNQPDNMNISNSDLMSFTRFSTAAVQEQTIYEKGDDDYGYRLYLNSSGRLVFTANGGAGANSITSAGTFNDGEIHDAIVLADYSSNGISLYVDGGLEANNSFAEIECSPIPELSLAGSNELNNDNFDGRIYQMRFSNRLMSPNEIDTLENNFNTSDFFYDVDNGPPLRPLDNSFYWGGQ